MKTRIRRPPSVAAELDASVLVAGVDEAGRGPSPAPSTWPAVILDRSRRALAASTIPNSSRTRGAKHSTRRSANARSPTA